MTFKLQLENGQKIVSPILLPYFDTIMEAFQGYKQNVKVLVHGIGKFNRSEKLQSIETIEHISILDSLDVTSRLGELRLLENGWLVENSIAPKNEDLDWFLENFEKNYNDELPLPYIFPTAEGNIQLEWEIDNYDISLEIDFGIHSAEWHNYNQESDTYESDNLNLEQVSGWESLCEKLNHVLLKKADYE